MWMEGWQHGFLSEQIDFVSGKKIEIFLFHRRIVVFDQVQVGVGEVSLADAFRSLPEKKNGAKAEKSQSVS